MSDLPTLKCAWCGVWFRRPGSRGPIPLYCSKAHRQRAYELRALSRRNERARVHLAYLMWCWSEGYLTKKDRAAGGGNWLLENPSKLHPEDAVTRARLLAMADEILAVLDRQEVEA